MIATVIAVAIAIVLVTIGPPAARAINIVTVNISSKYNWPARSSCYQYYYTVANVTITIAARLQLVRPAA